MTTIRVAIAASLGLHHFRSVVRGIKAYSAAKQEWVFLVVPPDKGHLRELKSSRPDGVIAQVHSPEFVSPLQAIKRPVVNTSRVFRGIPFSRIGIDEGQVGALVATHFLDRGFRNFAFVGHMEMDYCRQRAAIFQRTLEAAGMTADAYNVPRRMIKLLSSSPWSVNPHLRRWIMSLPKPVGIFAANDQSGFQMLEACRGAGLSVPEEVAIVGVDNDELLCDLSRPSLSSVALPSERVGYEAARLLDRLLSGKRPPTKPLLLPPLHVFTRQSSDLIAIDDPDIAAAVRYIRDHAHLPLLVTDVLKNVPVSRRGLERRFRMKLQRTLGQEIRRTHVERAKELLTGTDMPIGAVAHHAGFSDATQLSVVFRRETGLSPRDYRQRASGQFATVTPADD